jgi:hypothetical protein
MSIYYDDKGKFYTNIITKEAVPALIQTLTNRIKGHIYIRPGERVKDQVNQEEHFLAVTEAILYDLVGEELYRCDFLLVNREHIVWVLPEDQIQKPESEEKGTAS